MITYVVVRFTYYLQGSSGEGKRTLIKTLNAGVGFSERKSVLLPQMSVILTCISRINEPISGMFVLISMHLSW